jgi:hypothetical protein
MRGTYGVEIAKIKDKGGRYINIAERVILCWVDSDFGLLP